MLVASRDVSDGLEGKVISLQINFINSASREEAFPHQFGPPS